MPAQQGYRQVRCCAVTQHFTAAHSARVLQAPLDRSYDEDDEEEYDEEEYDEEDEEVTLAFAKASTEPLSCG